MKPSILVVDDDRSIRDGLERLLSQDYRVYKALNGSDALDIIRRHGNIDIVMCDIIMPVMDGIEMIKELRAENKEIIIIAATGSYLAEDVCDVIEKYVNIHLMKPLDIPQFELTLKNVLRNKESIRDNFSSPGSQYRLQEFLFYLEFGFYEVFV
jgi:CheY-like chemotaxis protein